MSVRTTAAMGGHDGPYAAPVAVGGFTVLPEWIDYNGHMNVAYYTLAADKALDRFVAGEIGIGPDFVAASRMGPYALQANYRYLAELHEGEAFAVHIRLIDHDAKRMHLFVELVRETGAVAATLETLLMNVDLEARRSAPYPDWAVARLARMKADHAALSAPEGLGAGIGLKRA